MTIFPDVRIVKLSWGELKRVVQKEGWKAALQNQKGVYLISDTRNGNMYVGSAYGENLLLGRWQSYAHNGHGANAGLKELPIDDIREYSQFSESRHF